MRYYTLFLCVFMLLCKIETKASGVDSLNVTSQYITVGETWYTDYYTSYSVYTNRSFFKDENDGLHMVFMSNYKLIYCFSSDTGNTWTTEEISTPNDGTFKLAVIYADADGNPYIATTVNSNFNYGNPTNVGYGEEFKYDVYFLFKEAGEWMVENVYMSNTSNYGMQVSELYMDENGDLVLIGDRFGWWTYGGSIYEFKRSEGIWSELNVIYEFSEASDNHFTFYSYTVLNSDGTKDIIFCRYSYNIGNPELLSIHFDGENWLEPISITGDLHNYVAWSMTTDTDGGSWLAYFSNSPSPHIELLSNLGEPATIDVDLSLVDTIQSIKVHYTKNGLLDLIVYPLNSDSAVLYVSEDYGVTWGEPLYIDRSILSGVLPQRDQLSDQSTDLEFMHIKRVSNVIPYGPDSLFYTHIEQVNTTALGINPYELYEPRLSFYPNPVMDEITINYTLDERCELDLRIFTLQGKLVYSTQILAEEGINQKKVNLNFLESGSYILEVYEKGQPDDGLHRSAMKMLKLPLD